MTTEKPLSEKRRVMRDGRGYGEDVLLVEDVAHDIERLKEKQFQRIDNTKWFSSKIKLRIMLLLGFDIAGDNKDFIEIMGDLK